jgi:hypothetical protein
VDVGAAAAPPDVAGAVEVVTGTRIAGWAADRANPDRPLDVEVWCDGTVLGRVRADRPREDLARGGLGDGRHGFEIRCEEPLTPDQVNRVEVLAVVGPDGATPVPLPRRGAGGGTAGGPRSLPPPGWLAELAALCKAIERHARRLDAATPPAAANASAVADSVGELCQLAAQLTAKLEAVDALQPRLDALAARLERIAQGKMHDRRPGRGLAWAVALTACLALASLGAGLAGYLS